MVASYVSRVVAEVVAADPTKAGVSRLGAQVAGRAHDANSQAATVSRIVAEVVADENPQAGVSRLSSQVAGQAHAANAQSALVSRLVAEIVAGPDAQAAVSRLSSQVAGQAHAANAQAALVSRIVAEVVAPQNTAGPIVPLPLADDIHVFLHNWVQQAEMRTSFQTDVRFSPETGAESRRGLTLKPFRSMRLEWLEGDDMTLSQLERLEVLLRRMTDVEFQVPIYMDQKELDQSYTVAGTDTINIKTDDARFFPGQRVVIVRRDIENQAVAFDFREIDSLTNASLTFTTALAPGETWDQGSLVFPCMDCEVMLEAVIDYSTARKARLTMTVSEVPGASQLPPIKSDNPVGFDVFEDRPIFDIEPDWTTGVRKGRKRQGKRVKQGRGDIIIKLGDRSRQYHSYTVNGKRDEMWPVVEFFETRRGRLRTFHHVDHDQYLEIAELDASGNFVGVSEIGDLADFAEEFDPGWVGIVMKDGTTYVRNVANIQQVLTVFRITVTPALPTNLDVTQVARVARSRITRFESDELREIWTTAGYLSASVSFIECLNEEDFPTTP